MTNVTKKYENKALINQPVIPFPKTTYSRLKNVVGLITLITLITLIRPRSLFNNYHCF